MVLDVLEDPLPFLARVARSRLRPQRDAGTVRCVRLRGTPDPLNDWRIHRTRRDPDRVIERQMLEILAKVRIEYDGNGTRDMGRSAMTSSV